MQPTPTYPAALYDRHDRAHARLAQRARLDTIHGGAYAVTLEKRLAALGSPLGRAGIVADIYSASTGRQSADHEAWECPECGAAHLGRDAAAACCNLDNDNADN